MLGWLAIGFAVWMSLCFLALALCAASARSDRMTVTVPVAS